MIIKISKTLVRKRESFIDYKYDFQVILRYEEHKRDTSHRTEVVCEQEKYFVFCLLYFHSVIMRESTYLAVRDGTASYVCYYSRLLNSCYSLFYSLFIAKPLCCAVACAGLMQRGSRDVSVTLPDHNRRCLIAHPKQELNKKFCRCLLFSSSHSLGIYLWLVFQMQLSAVLYLDVCVLIWLFVFPLAFSLIAIRFIVCAVYLISSSSSVSLLSLSSFNYLAFCHILFVLMLSFVSLPPSHSHLVLLLSCTKTENLRGQRERRRATLRCI